MATNREIQELYDKLWTDEAISRHLGIKREDVRSWRRRNGLLSNRGRRREKATEIVWDLRQKGYSYTAIVRKTGYSESAIRKWLKQRHLEAMKEIV